MSSYRSKNLTELRTMKRNSRKAVLTAGALFAWPTIVGAQGPHRTAYQFSFMSIDEVTLIKLDSYRGKVVLVVNTASLCGYTQQYQGLQTIWNKYRNKGFVVLAVPSNDFGGQEPKSESEIKDFCQGAFGVTYPLTKKYHVRGAKAHPFYKWADKITVGKGRPRWNFHKYLLGRDGRLINWFSSKVRPASRVLSKAIEVELDTFAKDNNPL